MMDKFKIPVCIFTLIMIGMFVVFLFHVPVRTGTPQIFRLRYYACQNGIDGGPLSSLLGEWDWRKAFVWSASDTEYRPRQFSQFFEVLTPRIYAHLYYWFGPFMWLPLCLVMAVVIGAMIALIVRQWTGIWLPGLVAGSFWLMTSEVLIGHHAPVRYVKDIVTIEMLGILSLLLFMRGCARARLWLPILAACGIWWLGIFTDEYPLFFFPAFAVAFLCWPWLRPVRWYLSISFLLLITVGLLLFLFLLPNFITPDIKEPLAHKAIRAMPGLAAKAAGNLKYFILNTRDVITYTFGWSLPHSRCQTILSIIAGCSLLTIIVIFRTWKGWGRMILFWGITMVAVGGILLPEGDDILHQVTYYNRPLVALMIVILGLFTSNIICAGKKGGLFVWLGVLTIIAGLNYHTAAWGVRNDPEEAYLTRYGLNNIIYLHDRLRSGELPAPVFVSYPRFKDVINGVYDELAILPWHTFDDGDPPWSLYRSIIPRLYLRHFEEGELRANPAQFARWIDADPHAYRAAVKCLYDIPAGIMWDLESIRSAAIRPDREIEWKGQGEEGLKSSAAADLLGPAPYTQFGKGSWSLTLAVPANEDRAHLVFALRHKDPVTFFVKGALQPGKVEGIYRWAWQLQAIELMPGIEFSELRVVTDGEAEVIGPVIVPGSVVTPVPPSRRKNVPPAGIPLLEKRGS